MDGNNRLKMFKRNESMCVCAAFVSERARRAIDTNLFPISGARAALTAAPTLVDKNRFILEASVSGTRVAHVNEMKNVRS